MPAPIKDPMLQLPCSPDISIRWLARSTVTPWAFMATSSEPWNAPRRTARPSACASSGPHPGHRPEASHQGDLHDLRLPSHGNQVRRRDHRADRPGRGTKKRDPERSQKRARDGPGHQGAAWSTRRTGLAPLNTEITATVPAAPGLCCGWRRALQACPCYCWLKWTLCGTSYHERSIRQKLIVQTVRNNGGGGHPHRSARRTDRGLRQAGPTTAATGPGSARVASPGGPGAGLRGPSNGEDVPYRMPARPTAKGAPWRRPPRR